MNSGVKHRFTKLEEMETLPQQAQDTIDNYMGLHHQQGGPTNHMMYGIYKSWKFL